MPCMDKRSKKYQALKKKYGKKRAERIFYATANKRGMSTRAKKKKTMLERLQKGLKEMKKDLDKTDARIEKALDMF